MSGKYLPSEMKKHLHDRAGERWTWTAAWENTGFLNAGGGRGLLVRGEGEGIAVCIAIKRAKKKKRSRKENGKIPQPEPKVRTSKKTALSNTYRKKEERRPEKKPQYKLEKKSKERLKPLVAGTGSNWEKKTHEQKKDPKRKYQRKNTNRAPGGYEVASLTSFSSV